MKARIALLFLPLGWLVLPASADEVIRLSTRPGVEQPFLLLEPKIPPKGAVVMFPGHEGVVRFIRQGDHYEVENESGGLTANRKMRATLQDHGFVVALLAPPSDQSQGMGTRFRSSPEHAEDVRQVIAFLSKRYSQKPYLQGHCRSSYSPASVATRLGNDSISGLILSSTRSQGKHGSVMDYDKGAVRVPVLLVHHTEDACPDTPYANVEQLKKFYQASSPNVELITVSGGDTKAGSSVHAKCSGGAHAFKGLQGEVARAITGWLEHKDFQRQITGARE